MAAKKARPRTQSGEPDEDRRLGPMRSSTLAGEEAREEVGGGARGDHRARGGIAPAEVAEDPGQGGADDGHRGAEEGEGAEEAEE